jgi:hypothetical protein
MFFTGAFISDDDEDYKVMPALVSTLPAPELPRAWPTTLPWFRPDVLSAFNCKTCYYKTCYALSAECYDILHNTMIAWALYDNIYDDTDKSKIRAAVRLSAVETAGWLYTRSLQSSGPVEQRYLEKGVVIDQHRNIFLAELLSGLGYDMDCMRIREVSVEHGMRLFACPGDTVLGFELLEFVEDPLIIQESLDELLCDAVLVVMNKVIPSAVCEQILLPYLTYEVDYADIRGDLDTYLVV